MKGLRFKQGDFHFIVDIRDILHVSSKKDVQEELKEIKHLDFKKLFNTGNSSEEVIFIGQDDNIMGLLVEKVIGLSEIGKVFPFEKENFAIQFIRGMIKFNDVIYYLIDFDKIIGVKYEEKSPSY